MTVRPASKAGTWYPADPQTLRAELDAYLAHPDPHLSGRVVAGIVPHAGLSYSGAVAGHVYAAMRRDPKPPETVLVFGAVHTMALSSPVVWPDGAWQTPLGDLPVDAELADALVDAGLAAADTRAHLGDNAIELQTPFLKHLFPEARILPVAVPPFSGAQRLGAAVADLCTELGRHVVALGSTDLSHYGAAYGYAPFGSGQRAHEAVMEVDRGFLSLLAEGRGAEAVAYAGKHRSACGAGAAAAATGFAVARGAGQGVVLQHTTSHEVCPDGDPSMFVGYAAMVFPAGDA